MTEQYVLTFNRAEMRSLYLLLGEAYAPLDQKLERCLDICHDEDGEWDERYAATQEPCITEINRLLEANHALRRKIEKEAAK